jgi:hypothetical protein
MSFAYMKNGVIGQKPAVYTRESSDFWRLATALLSSWAFAKDLLVAPVSWIFKKVDKW